MVILPEILQIRSSLYCERDHCRHWQFIGTFFSHAHMSGGFIDSAQLIPGCCKIFIFSDENYLF